MDMNNVWVGACKFCGQCVPGMYTDDMDQEQRNELATKNCDCIQAAAERKRKEQIRKAKERVETLFLGGRRPADSSQWNVKRLWPCCIP